MARLFSLLAVLSILASLPACSSEESGGKDGGGKSSGWTEERPPGIACTPAPPSHIAPSEGVSFDPAHMPCVQVHMDSADWAALGADTAFGAGLTVDEVFVALGEIAEMCAEPWPKEYSWYEASVTVDGVALQQVGIRRKGFIGSLFSSVPGLKVKTDKYVDGQFLGETERITLNNNAGDATHAAACLCYQIVAAAGHPAPRCNLANVMVNGEPLGPYTHIEAVKRRFLKRTFGDDTGSLYEGTVTDVVEEWLPRCEVKTDETDPDYGPLLALAEALQKPDEELLGALEPVLNLDRFATYWALEVLVNHRDGYTRSHNNYYVYFDPADGGRGVFIPWGIDKIPADEPSETLGMYVNAQVPRRLSRIPEAVALMEAELNRLITEVWDEDELLAAIDGFSAQVAGAQEGGPDEAQLESLRNWVKGRPAAVAALLAEGVPAGADEPSSCTAAEKGGDDTDGKDGGDDKDPGIKDCQTDCVAKGDDEAYCETACSCFDKCEADGGSFVECLACFDEDK